MSKSDVTPALLADLKEKAQKATPGSWEYNEAFVLVRLPDETELKDMAKPRLDTNVINVNRAFGPDVCKANAEYIAAMHPGMATALVDEIERLRAENARLEKELDSARYSEAHESGRAARLEREADWLANKLEYNNSPHECELCAKIPGGFGEPCLKPLHEQHCSKCYRNAARKAIDDADDDMEAEQEARER